MSNNKQKLNQYIDLAPELIQAFRNYGSGSRNSSNKIPDLAKLALAHHGINWTEVSPISEEDKVIRMLMRSHLNACSNVEPASFDNYWRRFQKDVLGEYGLEKRKIA
jgi:hypothetical protein